MSTTYPTPRVAFPNVPSQSASASTAGLVILLAIGFQVLGAVLLFAVVNTYVGWSIFNPYAYSWIVATGVFSIAAGVILLILFAFFFSYRPIQKGNYVSAQTPTLALGILSILTLNIISGVLYLIGYVKLGDAIREQRPPGSALGAPGVAAPPASLVACRACGRVFPLGSFNFCPNCGQKIGD